MKTRFASSLFVLCLASTVPAQNQNLRPIERIWEVDADADGTAIRIQVTTYTWDHHDLVSTATETDLDGDGIMDRRSTTTYTYDKHGRRLFAVIESRFIADGSTRAVWEIVSKRCSR